MVRVRAKGMDQGEGAARRGEVEAQRAAGARIRRRLLAAQRQEAYWGGDGADAHLRRDGGAPCVGMGGRVNPSGLPCLALALTRTHGAYSAQR